jgi:hypothetical protein
MDYAPRRHQAARSFSQKLGLSGIASASPQLHSSHEEVRLRRLPAFADRLRDPAWRFHAMDTSHSP